MSDDEDDADGLINKSLKQNIETLPTLWRILYNQCMSQGFSADEAMQLIKVYIFAFQGGLNLKP